MYLIDLHVHYKRRARDVEHFANEQVRQAAAVGLHGLAFTEHYQRLPPEDIERLSDTYQGPIYSGMEVGEEGDDYVVFGLDEVPKRIGYQALWGMVENAGGAMFLAHPFRRRPPPTERWWGSCPPHGIEIRSVHTPVAYYVEIARMAERHGLRTLQNSDAHKPRHVGTHFNVFDRLPADTAELIEMLRNRP